tara:strand:+ start:186 stop:410 length:225 start_codon:yes stop_codon:yes gene_type:complete
MKFIDKTFCIHQIIINVTIVDIFVRTPAKDAKLWPILNVDIFTIDNSFGISVTLPVIKLSIGWTPLPEPKKVNK